MASAIVVQLISEAVTVLGTLGINAYTWTRQNDMNKRLQNWTLFSQKRHEVAPVLWQKLYDTFSSAVRLVIDSFPDMKWDLWPPIKLLIRYT